MGKIAKTRLGVLYGVKNKKRSEAMKGSKGATCDSVIVNFTKEGFSGDSVRQRFYHYILWSKNGLKSTYRPNKFSLTKCIKTALNFG